MRIPDDVQKAVVFIGYPDSTPGKGGIDCIGTGFIIGYDQDRYLVTAKHIAMGIGDAPFLLRINKVDGTSENIAVDGLTDITWYFHESDRDVDVALIPFRYDLKSIGFDVRLIHPKMLLADSKRVKDEEVGLGDFCYVVGLFRLMYGNKRNLPVVHTGNIALMAGEDRVPVRDWESPDPLARRQIEAYLVQTENLEGLSGSPVFVRGNILARDLPTGVGPRNVYLPRANVLLLGIWQGSWDAKPDEVRAASRGNNIRVPVGMGLVVPASKIVEILEMSKLKEHRAQLHKELEAHSLAQPDAVERDTSLLAIDENPTHLEDFTRLVSLAARKPAPKD